MVTDRVTQQDIDRLRAQAADCDRACLQALTLLTAISAVTHPSVVIFAQGLDEPLSTFIETMRGHEAGYVGQIQQCISDGRGR